MHSSLLLLVSQLFFVALVASYPAEIPPVDPYYFPECAKVVYQPGNPNPDIYNTVYNCIANISDALEPPSYYMGSNATDILISFQVNSLIAVSELDGSATLDVFWRLYWADQRIQIPTLWDALAVTKPEILEDGAEIKGMVYSQDQLNMWLPDIFFTTGMDMNCMDDTIRLFPGGMVFWSRHCVMMLQQSHFNYDNYPDDEQAIELAVESYAFTQQYLNLTFTEENTTFYGVELLPPITVESGESPEDQFSQLWEYIGCWTLVQYSDYPRATAYISIERRSAGVIYRLALPIMLLLLLVGLTFWSEYHTRVDTTITILLAISALYIVIFSSIPMLGYLTKFDRYIMGMFVMIIGGIFAHQLTTRLMGKADRLPLRMIILRFIEFCGKVFMIPFVFMMFLINFTLKGHEIRFDTGIVMCVVFGAFLFSREIGGFNRCFKDAMVLIRTKVENPATHHVTNAELYVFNFYRFRVISRSAAHFHRWKHENDKAYALELEEERQRDLKAKKQREADLKLQGKAFQLRGDSSSDPVSSVLPRGLHKTRSQKIRVGEDFDSEDEATNPLNVFGRASVSSNRERSKSNSPIRDTSPSSGSGSTPPGSSPPTVPHGTSASASASGGANESHLFSSEDANRGSVVTSMHEL